MKLPLQPLIASIISNLSAPTAPLNISIGPASTHTCCCKNINTSIPTHYCICWWKISIPIYFCRGWSKISNTSTMYRLIATYYCLFWLLISNINYIKSYISLHRLLQKYQCTNAYIHHCIIVHVDQRYQLHQFRHIVAQICWSLIYDGSYRPKNAKPSRLVW